MKKWMFLITSILIIDSNVDAWGGRYRDNIEAEAASVAALPINYPLNPDQGWYVDQSYLLWKTTLGDLDYGIKTSVEVPDANTSHFKLKLKEPNFDWSSGVRIGLGRYLPNHDNWDISAYMTYVYGDAKGHSSGDLNNNVGISPTYGFFTLILSDDSHATWRLNYFVWDLILGREFSMTPKIVFHPYLGIRACLIDQDFRAHHKGNITVNDVTAQGTYNVSLDDDFWGVGLRGGSNFDFKIKRHWSLLGNFAAALMFGHYNDHERTTTHFSPGTVNIASPIITTGTDKDDGFRTNLEGSFGLGYETWVRRHSVRIAPAILFEGSVWFNMDDFFAPVTTFSQNHGSLGLMGLTFDLQIDF